MTGSGNIHMGSGNTIGAMSNGSNNTVDGSVWVAPASEREPEPDGGVTGRLGFVVDVIGYTSRPPAQRTYLQHRLVEVVDGALEDLGLGGDSDPGAGDDKMVFLPATTNPTTALPRLLAAITAQLDTNNTTYSDPIRLRLAIGWGLAGRGPNGFVGALPSLLGRLLDAPALRAAAKDKPWAAVVALVSEDLHTTVIRDGYAPALAAQLIQVEVTVKDFASTAWLWPRDQAS